MKRLCLLTILLLAGVPAQAIVRVFVEATNGMADLRYECTAGEVVRSFALDVSVDQGQIIEVTNYFRGLSTAGARGYGVFPASFRDNVPVSSGTNANWQVSGYSPLAAVADNPGGTLPGLNSSGVTLEFGALWDPAASAAIPPASGRLCSLRLSQTASVSVAANAVRGGLVGAPPELVITPQFAGALVGPAILGAAAADGEMTILFQGGELESAPTLAGPWNGTGNTSGVYTEPIDTAADKYFRVHYQ